MNASPHSRLRILWLGGAMATVALAPAAAKAQAHHPMPVATDAAPQAMATADAREAAVAIDNFTFAPAMLTVPVGTRVVWTNRDDIPHTVVSAGDPSALRSPPLDTGDQFAFTFGAPGTYHYFCSLHPHMQGTVVVR